MFKNLIFFYLLLISFNSHADKLKLNENIYENCKIDSLGVMYGCEVKELEIENVIAIKNRPDVQFHFIIHYDYSCEDNFTTNIAVVSKDGSSLGQFQYGAGLIEANSTAPLNIKDYTSFITHKAKYDKKCKLTLTSIEQDLSASTLSLLRKDICQMDLLNNQIAQTNIILKFTQDLATDIAVQDLPMLNSQLNTLSLHLRTIKNQTRDSKIQLFLENIVGTNSRPASIRYIISHDQNWTKSQLSNNIASLFNSLSNILTNMVNQSTESILHIYDLDHVILNDYFFQSSAELNSNLDFEMSLLQEKEIDNSRQPSC